MSEKSVHLASDLTGTPIDLSTAKKGESVVLVKGEKTFKSKVGALKLRGTELSGLSRAALKAHLASHEEVSSIQAAKSAKNRQKAVARKAAIKIKAK